MTRQPYRSTINRFAWCLVAAGAICVAVGVVGMTFSAIGGPSGIAVAATLAGIVAVVCGFVATQPSAGATASALAPATTPFCPTVRRVDDDAASDEPERVWVPSWRGDLEIAEQRSLAYAISKN